MVTNVVQHTTYIGRSPHEAFFTPDGSEVWVTIRGEDYVAVLDATTFEEKTRIKVAGGPGMQIFSPDGQYGFVCSSFNPDTEVISIAEHRIVGHVKQDSPFCPNIAATPDGKKVWLTLKDTGRVMVFDAHAPFSALQSIDTGLITNHVNFRRRAKGQFAYVTVGGLNKVKVFRTSDFAQVAKIPVGKLPNGIWPTGDGSRVYVGLEDGDALAVIDTATNAIIRNIPVGQAPQALVYVSNAVPKGEGTQDLVPLGIAGQVAHLILTARLSPAAKSAGGQVLTSVSLFDQGLIQILQASVTGLEPKAKYILALASNRDGSGALQPLAAFTTNPAGSAIVDAAGPIRQLVTGETGERRFLVIAPGPIGQVGAPIQVQTSE